MTAPRPDTRSFSSDPVPDLVLPDPSAPESGLGGATQWPRQQVLDVMQRAGYSAAQIEEVHALLPEQVDRNEDHVVLDKYGLTAAALMDRMGSSP